MNYLLNPYVIYAEEIRIIKDGHPILLKNEPEGTFHNIPTEGWVQVNGRNDENTYLCYTISKRLSTPSIENIPLAEPPTSDNNNDYHTTSESSTTSAESSRSVSPHEEISWESFDLNVEILNNLTEEFEAIRDEYTNISFEDSMNIAIEIISNNKDINDMIVIEEIESTEKCFELIIKSDPTYSRDSALHIQAALNTYIKMVNEGVQDPLVIQAHYEIAFDKYK